jgi:hypothetical protein
MGAELSHDRVKLVIPVLYSDEKIYRSVFPELTDAFGETDRQSEPFEFTFTDYYNEEMSVPITRVFLSFRTLIRPEDLVDIKLKTNRIETAHAVDGKRKVNLDPGYLELGKFVLATTKDQQHRLYIGQGIYEEITLFFRDKKWRDWEWTYPDYRSERYKAILMEIREIYKKQLPAGK